MPSCSANKSKGDCRCCKTCTFKLPGNAKLWHQGVVMSGCGKPPGSCDFNPNLCCGGGGSDDPSCAFPSVNCACVVRDEYVPDEDLCQPVDKDGTYPFHKLNFLYENWIDTCSLTWYVLQRDAKGVPIGYNVVVDGAGDVEILNRALAGTHGRDVTTNIPGVNDARSFVFLAVPPSPLEVASFIPTGQGETLTPDYVLTNDVYGYQVYIRDKRNNRYYRDSYNSHCTEPLYPCDPCDSDCFDQKLVRQCEVSATPVPVPYEFDAEFCQWYLADACEQLANLSLAATAECELACCWNRCGKRIGKNADCTGEHAAANQKNCVTCPKVKKNTKSCCH